MQNTLLFPVSSSVMTYIGHANDMMFIQFWPYKGEKNESTKRSGSIYSYRNVEGWKVRMLMKADSKGKFFNYFLRDKNAIYNAHRLSPSETESLNFKYMDDGGSEEEERYRDGSEQRQTQQSDERQPEDNQAEPQDNQDDRM